MPQSFSCLHLHLVFSTKNREPFLGNLQLRKEMHAYLGEISNKLDCPSIVVGGTEDHVHILSRLGKSISHSARLGKGAQKSIKHMDQGARTCVKIILLAVRVWRVCNHNF